MRAYLLAEGAEAPPATRAQAAQPLESIVYFSIITRGSTKTGKTCRQTDRQKKKMKKKDSE